MPLDLITAEARHLARCEFEIAHLGFLARVILGAPFTDPDNAALVYGSLSLAVEAGESAARHGRWPTPEFVRDFAAFRDNAWAATGSGISLREVCDLLERLK